jgi:hypothetical protein
MESLSYVNLLKPACLFVVSMPAAFSSILISSSRGSGGCIVGDLFPAAAEAGVERDYRLELLEPVVNTLELGGQ